MRQWRLSTESILSVFGSPSLCAITTSGQPSIRASGANSKRSTSAAAASPLIIRRIFGRWRASALAKRKVTELETVLAAVVWVSAGMCSTGTKSISRPATSIVCSLPISRSPKSSSPTIRIRMSPGWRRMSWRTWVSMPPTFAPRGSKQWIETRRWVMAGASGKVSAWR